MLDVDTIRSTKSEIEEFVKSPIWLDIVDELTSLDKRSQDEYDMIGEPIMDLSGHRSYPNSSEVLISLGDIKGRRQAVKYFLNIPDIMLQILEEKKNDLEREPAD